MMPAQSDIDHYLAKSGDTSFKRYLPLVEVAGGWFNYLINEDENEFIIVQALGDVKAIVSEAQRMAKHLGCTGLVFGTRRNGKAFAKLTGGKVIASVIQLPLEG